MGAGSAQWEGAVTIERARHRGDRRFLHKNERHERQMFK